MRFSNVFWNLLGLSLPLLIAALTVPALLNLIGSERFGFLALAWGLIGYAGALDLGIGRATTQHISVLRGRGDDYLVPDVLATAVRMTLLTGGIGMLLIALAAICGVYRLIQSHTVPAIEIEEAMLLLAFALPVQAISATYRGVNEAYLNFKSISLLRIALGAANFGAPYLMALFTHKVQWLIATLVVSRCLALLFYRMFAHACLERAGHKERGSYSKLLAQKLLQFGGWFTVSSVVSPMLVQADRFFVGALIAASAVTLYVIPYELTVQSLILVGAITTVAFPVISQKLQGSSQEALSVFRLWLFRVAALMFVAMVVLAFILPELLYLWLGKNAAPESVSVGRILCIGVFFNAIGAMYFSLLHAYGKTKITAIIHIVELPFFIVALYFFIGAYGVRGASIAWVLRMIFDTSSLILAERYFNGLHQKPSLLTKGSNLA